MLNIAAIPTELLDFIWPQAEPILKRPIDRSHGEVTLDSIYKKLKNGDALLVTISEGDKIIACNTMEVRTFESGKRAMAIPLTGGDKLDEWMADFLEVAEAIAKDFNCQELRGFAVRKGWMRKLNKYGWEEVSTIIKKEVQS